MMFDIFLNDTYIQSKHEHDVFGPLIKVHSPKLKVSRLDKGSRANQLRQVENSHNAVQGGVGGRFWAVRCGATRLSWVWPEICWLWLEQSIPYHGAWCSGMFLKTFGMFLLPVQVSLTCHFPCSKGVRSYCVTKCLHDPHAPRAQLWHLKVSLQSELPLLLDDSEGRVPPRPFSKVRFCCSQVPHSTEEHLKTVSVYFSTQENDSVQSFEAQQPTCCSATCVSRGTMLKPTFLLKAMKSML